jgi:hypothetical protein
MRRILIHAGVSPFDTISAADMLLTNPIEDNIGNLLFQNSVFRTFMDKGVQIDPDFYNFDSSAERAYEINTTYDCYLLPLANYFRESYIPYLRKQTELIRQLKIPVIVIGVGLQANTNHSMKDGFPFDSDVRDFVKAVLNRSSIVGLRGETTARYLTALGFRAERDFTVIGCPSMYTFGRDLQVKSRAFTKDSLVCVNSARKRINDVTSRYLESNTQYFAHHYFIPQDIDELKLVFTGHGSVSYRSSYSEYMTEEIYKSDSVRFPLNVATWLKFLRKTDLVFGPRIHGNIAGILAGTPSLLFPGDARTLEIAKYHDLNYVRVNKSNESVRLIDLLENIDFAKPMKKHAQNFDHYIDFLNKNNLEHIYNKDRNRKNAPYDAMTATIRYPEMVKAAETCTNSERLARLESYYPRLDSLMKEDLRLAKKRVVRYQEKLDKAKSRLDRANTAIQNRDAILNRKIVRIALRSTSIMKGGH